MNQHEKQTAALTAEVAALKRRVEALEAAAQTSADNKVKAGPKTGEPKAP